MRTVRAAENVQSATVRPAKKYTICHRPCCRKSMICNCPLHLNYTVHTPWIALSTLPRMHNLFYSYTSTGLAHYFYRAVSTLSTLHTVRAAQHCCRPSALHAASVAHCPHMVSHATDNCPRSFIILRGRSGRSLKSCCPQHAFWKQQPGWYQIQRIRAISIQNTLYKAVLCSIECVTA